MITCLGEPLLDLFALPVGSVMETATSFKPCPGGAPLNVAVVLGRCGVPVRFVGAVGMGALGDRLLLELAHAGVDVGCTVRSDKKAGMVFIEVRHDGQRRFLGYTEGGSEYDYWVADYRAQRPDPLDDSAWLVVGSGSLTQKPMSVTLRLVVSRAKDADVPVVVDLNVRPHLWHSQVEMLDQVTWLARQATVLKASEDDLQALGLAAELSSLEQLNPQAVGILTRGARGACLRRGSTVLERPANTVKVMDSTGAGDAFAAGVLLSLQQQEMHPLRTPGRFTDSRRWPEVLATACRLGAHAVTQVGATEAFRFLDPALLGA